MVEQIREKISNHRKKIVPGLIALSLLSGLVVSLVSTPNALADYNVGCGYGYNSSGGGFGYGTGNAFGYGYGLNGVFGFGYGNQVCPTTTTTTQPTTTTTSGVGGTTTTSSTTTTSTTSTTTTTAPVTTTTTVTHHGRPPLFCKKDHGSARVGRTVKNAITGGGFYGRPKITSNEFGTKVGVIHDYGNLLIAKVTVRHGSKLGWHTFKISVADGRFCKVNYLVK
jgi:hypothetical protein